MILSDYDEKLETQKTISFRHDFQIANEYTLFTFTTTNKIKGSQNPWMESKFFFRTKIRFNISRNHIAFGNYIFKPPYLCNLCLKDKLFMPIKVSYASYIRIWLDKIVASPNCMVTLI